MKLLTLKFIVIFIYLISSTSSYAIQQLNLDNLVIHKDPKKLEKINFQNINNETVNLSKFKNSLIVINFWATWCAPCKKEMPHLNRLKAKNVFKDIEIIPINIADEELKKSKEFFEKLNINNLEIYYGSSLDLAKEFKLRGIPTTIFIDREGFEFARVIGFIDFENKVFLDWLNSRL